MNYKPDEMCDEDGLRVSAVSLNNSKQPSNSVTIFNALHVSAENQDPCTPTKNSELNYTK